LSCYVSFPVVTNSTNKLTKLHEITFCSFLTEMMTECQHFLVYRLNQLEHIEEMKIKLKNHCNDVLENTQEYYENGDYGMFQDIQYFKQEIERCCIHNLYEDITKSNFIMHFEDFSTAYDKWLQKELTEIRVPHDLSKISYEYLISPFDLQRIYTRNELKLWLTPSDFEAIQEKEPLGDYFIVEKWS
jgi:hypothetical protein